MGGMFERFTDRARRVVELAEGEARTRGHDYIGTEHVLLGLLAESGGVAERALNQLGITRDRVGIEVDRIIGRGETPITGHIPFTKRAKKCLELSLREALQLGHNYIGTEHLLLGLVREKEGVAAEVLTQLGADLESVRNQVIATLIERGENRVAKAVGDRTPGTIGGRSASRDLFESAQRSAERDLLRSVRKKPAIGPACPNCGASLVARARYEVVDVPSNDGESTAKVAFLFCLDCGHTLDDVILPDE